MTARISLSPAGQTPADVQAGDFILCRGGKSVVDRAIRFGQGFRIPRRYCWASHAAGIIDGSGTLVEMLADGATISPLQKYQEQDYVHVRPALSPERQAEAAAYWQWLAETHVAYGWWSIAADALALITHLPIGSGWAGRPVCSASVAAGLGLNEWRANPADVMPATLAERYGIEAPK